MSLFKCKVLSSSGSIHVMKLDGLSKEDIIENLRKSSFIIIDVKNIGHTLSKIALAPKIKKVRIEELALFCKQMNTMLNSGITIVKCLEILTVQTENKRFRTVLQKIYKELLTGSTFSEAIYNNKESFPVLLFAMVQAGELSGNVELAMERMSSHYGKEHKIQNKVKSALAYPLILSVVATAVVIFLLVRVMPTFVNLYRSSGVSLPVMTRMLLNISEWIENMWLATILFAAFIVFVGNRLYQINNIKIKMDYLKLHVPYYGALKVKLAASRVTRTLATLLSSGVHLLEGLETASMIVGNEYISRLVLNAREDVRRGSSLAFSIYNQKIFPPIVHSMINLGEESGKIEEVLDRTADFFDEEVENSLEKLIAMVEPIMIVVMAVIVGFIMLAVITPMFDMVNTVQ